MGVQQYPETDAGKLAPGAAGLGYLFGYDVGLGYGSL
jgi:hypothetical protein